MAYVQRLAPRVLDDPVAAVTLLLAAVTVLAIIIPLVVQARDAKAKRVAKRQRLAVLLDALVEMLAQQQREPAWHLGTNANTLVEALLDDALLNGLNQDEAKQITGAVVMAHRVLTGEDRISQARLTQNTGMFEEIRSAATAARARVEDARKTLDVDD